MSLIHRETASRHPCRAVVVRRRSSAATPRRGTDRRSRKHDPRQCGIGVEVCTKVRIGKLPTGASLCEDFLGYVQRFHFTPLPISVEHGRLAGRLQGPHKDPFDRMLAAQALLEGVPLATNDPSFAKFGVNVIW